ncbi:MAG: hypothetical protein ACFCGT_01360 [Sandaracinaceae bacterium]
MTSLRTLRALGAGSSLALLLIGCGGGEDAFVCEPVDSSDRAELWANDIDCVRRALAEEHVDPFTVVSAETFEARLDALLAAVPDLSDDEVRVELARVAALLGDAHTLVAFLDAGDFLPIQVFFFGEDLYVVRAGPGLDDLIATRLVRIGARPVAALLPEVRELISHEVEQRVRHLGPTYLMSTLVLRELGAIDDGDVELGLETQRGEPLTRVLSPVGPAAWDALPGPAGALPLYRRMTDLSYWAAVESGDDLVYVAFNRARDEEAEPFAAFTERVLAQVGAGDRLVIDLRRNGGGSSLVFRPMLDAIAEDPALDDPDRLFVIVGRATFSAAVLNAHALRAQTSATFVGEPLGQPVNHFGEVRSFELPFSGGVVSYSTRSFEPADQDLEVDVPAPPAAESFFTGRDPALDAILAR